MWTGADRAAGETGDATSLTREYTPMWGGGSPPVFSFSGWGSGEKKKGKDLGDGE